MDSKSIGLCPQGFESPRCRLASFHSWPTLRPIHLYLHSPTPVRRGIALGRLPSIASTGTNRLWKDMGAALGSCRAALQQWGLQGAMHMSSPLCRLDHHSIDTKGTSTTAAIAQLVARRSHNPKAVSSILTRRTFPTTRGLTDRMCFLSLLCTRWCFFSRNLALLRFFLSARCPARCLHPGIAPTNTIALSAPPLLMHLTLPPTHPATRPSPTTFHSNF